MSQTHKFKRNTKPRSVQDTTKTSDLLESSYDEAESTLADAQRLLVELESILRPKNHHCVVLRSKYNVLQDAVEELSLDLEDFEFVDQSLNKIRANVTYLRGQVKKLNTDFEKYYSKILKTCVKKLEEDFKLVKVGRRSDYVFKEWKDFKKHMGIVNEHVKTLKEELKDEKWLQSFFSFWSDFALVHDEVKRLTMKFYPELVESSAEEYLDYRVERK